MITSKIGRATLNVSRHEFSQIASSLKVIRNCLGLVRLDVRTNRAVSPAERR